jgi:tagatose 6-phosphate kinase
VITVFGLNTSIDKAADLDDLAPGAVNRIRNVRRYPGGKGLHVALTVATLGEPVRLVGLIDAVHRKEFEDFLSARSVEFHPIDTPGPIRTCLSLRDRNSTRTTELLEPGPETDAATRQEALRRVLALARGSSSAVLSGSLPPGFDDHTYADLVTELRKDGVRALVDASGRLLAHAVAARPFLIKPNRDEAEALTGKRVDSLPRALRAARSLSDRGIDLVVLSLGAEGALAVTPDQALHGRVEVARTENAVGSGDCLLGGIAVAQARNADLAELLRLGVACGAANAKTRDTGSLRAEDVASLQRRASITPL